MAVIFRCSVTCSLYSRQCPHAVGRARPNVLCFSQPPRLHPQSQACGFSSFTNIFEKQNFCGGRKRQKAQHVVQNVNKTIPSQKTYTKYTKIWRKFAKKLAISQNALYNTYKKKQNNLCNFLGALNAKKCTKVHNMA